MSKEAAAQSIFQIINGLQQADLIRQSSEISKEISEINAEFLEQDAQNALMFGLSQAEMYQNVINKVEARTKVNLATKGIDADFGTIGELRAENELTGFLNKAKLRNQAYANAMGYKVQIMNTRLQGVMGQIQSEAAAGAVRAQGILQAGSTFASGYAKPKVKIDE